MFTAPPPSSKTNRYIQKSVSIHYSTPMPTSAFHPPNPLYSNLFAKWITTTAENRWRRQAERERGLCGMWGAAFLHRRRRRHSIWTCPGQPCKNTSLLCRLVDGFAVALVWLYGPLFTNQAACFRITCRMWPRCEHEYYWCVCVWMCERLRWRKDDMGARGG